MARASKRIKAADRKAARQVQIESYKAPKVETYKAPKVEAPTQKLEISAPAPAKAPKRAKNRIKASERKAVKKSQQLQKQAQQPKQKPKVKVTKYKENVFAPERKQGKKALEKQRRAEKAKAKAQAKKIALEVTAPEPQVESPAQSSEPLEKAPDFAEVAVNNFLAELRFYPSKLVSLVMEYVRPVIEEYGRSAFGVALLKLPHRWIEYFQSSQYDSGQGAAEFQSALLELMPEIMQTDSNFVRQGEQILEEEG